MPVSLVDIATMTASCSRIQAHQRYVLSSLFVVVCLFLLAGRGSFGASIPLRLVDVVKPSRYKADMAAHGLLFHMLLWTDVALSMDVGFSCLRCCVSLKSLRYRKQ